MSLRILTWIGNLNQLEIERQGRMHAGLIK
jgi:hypothetical protein